MRLLSLRRLTSPFSKKYAKGVSLSVKASPALEGYICRARGSEKWSQGTHTVRVQALPGRGAVMKSREVLISCSCPAWKYWGADYNAAENEYSQQLYSDGSPPDENDPGRVNLLCKHAYVAAYALRDLPVPTRRVPKRVLKARLTEALKAADNMAIQRISIAGEQEDNPSSVRLLRTSVDRGHAHIAYVDGEGNGTTSVSARHDHLVIGGVVDVDAGQTHSHTLLSERVRPRSDGLIVLAPIGSEPVAGMANEGLVILQESGLTPTGGNVQIQVWRGKTEQEVKKAKTLTLSIPRKELDNVEGYLAKRYSSGYIEYAIPADAESVSAFGTKSFERPSGRPGSLQYAQYPLFGKDRSRGKSLNRRELKTLETSILDRWAGKKAADGTLHMAGTPESIARELSKVTVEYQGKKLTKQFKLSYGEGIYTFDTPSGVIIQVYQSPRSTKRTQHSEVRIIAPRVVQS